MVPDIHAKFHNQPFIIIIIIIIRQPLSPVVGRRPQHVVSTLACLVLSSAISCRSSICAGRISTAWLVSLVVFPCHIWYPSGDARGPPVIFEAVDMPCPGPFHFPLRVDYIYEFCPLPHHAPSNMATCLRTHRLPHTQLNHQRLVSN